MAYIKEEDLDLVSGGLTNNEIIDSIDLYYSFLPQDVRNSLVTALINQGKEKARELALRIVKTIPLASGIEDLFV